jgi:hypothetical protein
MEEKDTKRTNGRGKRRWYRKRRKRHDTIRICGGMWVVKYEEKEGEEIKHISKR